MGTFLVHKARRRRFLVAVAAGVLGSPFRSHCAAPPAARLRLGILFWAKREFAFGALGSTLRKHLGELGYVEGRNLEFEWRYSDGEESRLAPLAADLVRSGVNVLYAEGTPATRALQGATRTIPIVAGVGDAVGSGFARSLAMPGGNITGITEDLEGMGRKQIQLLRAVIPGLARIVVFSSRRYGAAEEITRHLFAAAQAEGISPELRVVSGLDEIESGLKALRGPKPGAAIIFSLDGPVDRSALLGAAIRHRIPTMCRNEELVRQGGLMHYRLYWPDEYARVAALIDQVFRGKNPGEIPFEMPTRSRFVINRETARKLNLEIPAELLLRADEVIG